MMMQKFFFVLCLVSWSLLSLQSQDFGIQVGANYSNVSSADDLDRSNILGYNIGIVGKTNLDQALNIQSGLLFTQRGTKVVSNDGTRRFRTSFVEVPLHLVFRIGREESGFILFAGPYFSYGVTSRIVDTDGTILNGYQSASYDINRYDTGFNAGVGLDIANIRISLRYSYGFVDTRYFGSSRLLTRLTNLNASYYF